MYVGTPFVKQGVKSAMNQQSMIMKENKERELQRIAHFENQKKTTLTKKIMLKEEVAKLRRERNELRQENDTLRVCLQMKEEEVHSSNEQLDKERRITVAAEAELASALKKIKAKEPNEQITRRRIFEGDENNDKREEARTSTYMKSGDMEGEYEVGIKTADLHSYTMNLKQLGALSVAKERL